MRLGKYLLAPWFSLAVYTLLSVYNGPAGLVPYRALLSERQKVLENIDTLGFINQKLEGEMDALLYDAETIRIKARELGYGEARERFVRIVGLPVSKPNELKPGTVRTAIQPLPPGKAQRLIAICLGLLLFGFFLVMDFLVKKTDADGVRNLRV